MRLPGNEGAATGDRRTAQEAGGQAAEASCDPIRRLLVSGRELEPCSASGGQGGMAPGRAVPSGGLHRHEHVGWPGRGSAFLQWAGHCRAVDQRGQVRPELDSAVLPSVRGQSSASVSVHPGLQPWELPAPVMPAQRGQALVAEERPGQADQDGRSAGAPLPAVDLSVVRGVGSSTVVSGSVGSYRPVIAGAKLRENATTILPRGRALQGVALSSMRVHPIGGGPKDDEDGQEAWFTARIASLIGIDRRLTGLAELNMMPLSRSGCSLSLKTANMGNPGLT